MIIINAADTQTFNIIPRNSNVEYDTDESGNVRVLAGKLSVKFVEEETNDGSSTLNNQSVKYDNYLALNVTTTSNRFRKNFNYFMTVTNFTTGKLVYRDRVMVLADSDVPYDNKFIHSINDNEYDPYVGSSSDNEYIILND
tara:strand:- start:8 stop:430 length:423 start_codon:yes stop_codon:yes gene_type:complete